MTSAMAVSPGEGINLGTYTYTSEPRTIPFSATSRRNSKNGRLIRGSNFGNNPPQWAGPEGSEGGLSIENTPRFRRQTRPSISVATQVNESERSSQLTTLRTTPEETAIKTLVANTVREAALEVASEAESVRAQIEEIEAAMDAEDAAEAEADEEDPPAEGDEAPEEGEEEETKVEDVEDDEADPDEEPEAEPDEEPEADPDEEEPEADPDEEPTEADPEPEDGEAPAEDDDQEKPEEEAESAS